MDNLDMIPQNSSNYNYDMEEERPMTASQLTAQ